MSSSDVPKPQTNPGVASAEDGLVILDGPNGIAVTMTSAAARQTAESLLLAADIADQLARETKIDKT